MNTESNIAWAAGLFEGEGCISILASKGAHRTARVVLGLSMTDQDTVEKFAAVVGAGEIYKYPRRPRRKQIWMWKLQDTHQCCEFLRKVQPLLGTRRSQKAEEAIAIDDERWRICYCGKHFYAHYNNRCFCDDNCSARFRRTEIGIA